MTILKFKCLAKGCEGISNEPGAARKMCVTHYNEYRRALPPVQCLIADCDIPANWPGAGRGYCSKHLYRVKKHGSATVGGRLPNGLDTKTRIELKIVEDVKTGCWLWQDKPDKFGYGKLIVNGKCLNAHRASYEVFVGPIPRGLHIDHLCEVRICVNPSHLEPVTRAENSSRAWYRKPEHRIENIVYVARKGAKL